MTYSLIFCIAASMLLAACSTPSQRFDATAQELGFQKILVKGKGFPHVGFVNGKMGTTPTLHVYLGGDGTPWIGGFIVASDPTPRRPVVLELMAKDDSPSLFLGRPCYHGYASRQPCTPELWTAARYSTEVIDSMAQALRNIMHEYGCSELHLIGFSGGGSLAMFLAERLSETRTVVTIAGNLDIETWVALHGYDPLVESMNPKTMPPLSASVRQYHLAGGRDKNIPPAMIREALHNQSDSQFILIDDFTHGCCWDDIWEAVLSCLENRCTWSEALQDRVESTHSAESYQDTPRAHPATLPILDGLAGPQAPYPAGFEPVESARPRSTR